MVNQTLARHKIFVHLLVFVLYNIIYQKVNKYFLKQDKKKSRCSPFGLLSYINQIPKSEQFIVILEIYTRYTTPLCREFYFSKQFDSHKKSVLSNLETKMYHVLTFPFYILQVPGDFSSKQCLYILGL